MGSISMYTSRALPSFTYLDDKDNTITDEPSDPLLFQSDPAVWTELGVMIPFLDMLNHEAESSQVVWVSPPALNGKDHASCLPRAVSHRRVKKKGSELYCNYGPNMSNQHLILQYGFGLINNPSDVVRLGWSLADSVGNVKVPVESSLQFKDEAPDDRMSIFGPSYRMGGSHIPTQKTKRKAGTNSLKQRLTSRRQLSKSTSTPYLPKAASWLSMMVKSVLCKRRSMGWERWRSSGYFVHSVLTLCSYILI